MVKLKDTNLIREFARRLTAKSKHHMQTVCDVLPHVLWQTIIRCDQDEGISVRQHTEMRWRDAKKRGKTTLGNIAFFFVHGARYALCPLGHKKIALRLGNSRGKLLASFDNSSTPQQVESAFRNL
jgi:hypothetical protein